MTRVRTIYQQVFNCSEIKASACCREGRQILAQSADKREKQVRACSRLTLRKALGCTLSGDGLQFFMLMFSLHLGVDMVEAHLKNKLNGFQVD